MQIRWETEKRYYTAKVYQDLLGDWVVEKSWGGLQNNLGHSKIMVVPSLSFGVIELVAIHKLRRARHYGIVASR